MKDVEKTRSRRGAQRREGGQRAALSGLWTRDLGRRGWRGRVPWDGVVMGWERAALLDWLPPMDWHDGWAKLDNVAGVVLQVYRVQKLEDEWVPLHI